MDPFDFTLRQLYDSDMGHPQYKFEFPRRMTTPEKIVYIINTEYKISANTTSCYYAIEIIGNVDEKDVYELWFFDITGGNFIVYARRNKELILSVTDDMRIKDVLFPRLPKKAI